MKIFLDTSSLFKLYHREAGTEQIELIFKTNKITNIFLSEISKVEFVSTIWKKVRTKEITDAQAITTVQLFESDQSKYSFVATNSIVIEQALKLISVYGKDGLRTLDSLQLSTCLQISKQADLFLTSDILLNTLFQREGLATEIPQ